MLWRGEEQTGFVNYIDGPVNFSKGPYVRDLMDIQDILVPLSLTVAFLLAIMILALIRWRTGAYTREKVNKKSNATNNLSLVIDELFLIPHVMSAIAAADGTLHKNEVLLLQTSTKKKIGNEIPMAVIEELFEHYTKNPSLIFNMIHNMKPICSKDTLLSAFEGGVLMSLIDGNFAPEEHELLNKIAEALGFDKELSNELIIQVLPFKSGEAAFEYICKYMPVAIEKDKLLPCLVVRAHEIREDGIQIAVIKLPDKEGGTVAVSETVSRNGPQLKEGDMAIWMAGSFIDKNDYNMWSGIILSTLEPVWSSQNGWKTKERFRVS